MRRAVGIEAGHRFQKTIGRLPAHFKCRGNTPKALQIQGMMRSQADPRGGEDLHTLRNPHIQFRAVSDSVGGRALEGSAQPFSEDDRAFTGTL